MNQEEQTGAEQALAGQEATPLGPAAQAGSETPAVAEEETLQRRPFSYGPQRGLFGIQTFFTVVIFSIFVITFIVQAFQIPSGSMENTLLIGDFLLVDKLHFAGDPGTGKLLPYGRIEHGDIIVFYFPVNPQQFLVKRVIGLPGDHVRLRNKVVYVNGIPLHENYALHEWGNYNSYRDNFPAQVDTGRMADRRWRYQMLQYVQNGEIVVPSNQYFVLGDNRENSDDSRYWGFVPRANIIGRPLVIYLSVREPGSSNDKLLSSGPVAHWLHMARWDRMFHLVR
jgi:signal peptidase I